MLRRAGLVHGFGRLGVSNSIWDRPGSLSAGEWERVRMSSYLTERMLHQSAARALLGAIAVQRRERLDGSGYPRNCLAPRSPGRPGSWPPPTSTSQCASPGRTGRPDHVGHIYAKIDASNRATAAMFAVRRGLLPEETITITAAL